MSKIRVLLVDDQAIILDGLVALLHNDPDIEVVGIAKNGEEAVRSAEQVLPNVVVMDISMPLMDGIEATRIIKEKKAHRGCHVMMLSMYHLQSVIDDAFDAGAMGYILKNTTQAQFKEAIRTVAKGQRYIAAEVQKELDGMALRPVGGGNTTHPLTKREKEIVLLIANERSTIEIAESLGLSEETVHTHRKNIMHKLSVKNVAGLVKYAMERGWFH